METVCLTQFESLVNVVISVMKSNSLAIQTLHV